ncbi:MAG: hypothetical protein U0640_11660 [Phycisphaerales bacterium]
MNTRLSSSRLHLTGLVSIGLSSVLLTGCSGPSKPVGQFEVSLREPAVLSENKPQVSPKEYKVLFVGEDSRETNTLSDKERDEMRGLTAARSGIVHELRERGFLVTSNPTDKDIDACVNYGYSCSGERGTQFSSTPGYTYAINGSSYYIPGTATASPYAHDQQTLRIEVFDWNELKNAQFEFGRVRPVWRGSATFTFNGMNGMQQDESEQLAMNLLFDFPVPRITGKAERQFFTTSERGLLFALPVNPSDSKSNLLARH